MKNNQKKPAKFVRLKVSGEIVELESHHPEVVTIKYRGENVMVYPHDITHLTEEEETEHRNKLSI